jgi:hypothetical protein
MVSRPIIAFENVGVAFGENRIYDRLSFDVRVANLFVSWALRVAANPLRCASSAASSRHQDQRVLQIDRARRHEFDFKVVLVEDCCAALSDDEHRSALENVIQQFGDVMTADEVVVRLRQLENDRAGSPCP